MRYTEERQEITGKPPGSVMTIEFQLAGYKFIGLNGPQFTFTPAISFFVICETETEVDALWETLSKDGGVLMELGKYDWSEKYGWVKDRYGLTWQLAAGRIDDVGQKITPCLLFVGKQHGRAEEAIDLYTEVFPDSKVDGILHYSAGEGQPEGTVKHAQFSLNNEKFMAMDSALAHSFDFNEAYRFRLPVKRRKKSTAFGQSSPQMEAKKARVVG
jgi:predicted 3-demethylubiquinone-9 3-methyltransferase (glyoxalase superfamily)